MVVDVNINNTAEVVNYQQKPPGARRHLKLYCMNILFESFLQGESFGIFTILCIELRKMEKNFMIINSMYAKVNIYAK